MTNRRNFLKGMLAAMLAGLLGGYYALRIEPGWRLRVRTWRVRSRAWPESWDRQRPLRIVMVADLHAGVPNMGPDRVARIVAAANALQGDLILLMGDYRATHPYQSRRVEVAEVAPILARLQAPLGVFAILGNHDWRDDHAAFQRRASPVRAQVALEAAGIAVIRNGAVRIDNDRGPFWLLGLDSQAAFSIRMVPDVAGADDLPGTLALLADDAPAILLAHEPDIFPKVPDRVALTLSGHTHGGQVRLFGWAPIVPSAFGGSYCYGHIEEAGRHLVVSGGLGCSGYPLRLGVPPELTVVELSA